MGTKRVMASSIGGLIDPNTSWKLRILARELGVTISKAAEYAANQAGQSLGISFDEIPTKEPTWLVSRVEGSARQDWKELQDDSGDVGDDAGGSH